LFSSFVKIGFRFGVMVEEKAVAWLVVSSKPTVLEVFIIWTICAPWFTAVDNMRDFLIVSVHGIFCSWLAAY